MILHKPEKILVNCADVQGFFNVYVNASKFPLPGHSLSSSFTNKVKNLAPVSGLCWYWTRQLLIGWAEIRISINTNSERVGASGSLCLLLFWDKHEVVCSVGFRWLRLCPAQPSHEGWQDGHCSPVWVALGWHRCRVWALLGSQWLWRSSGMDILDQGKFLC